MREFGYLNSAKPSDRWNLNFSPDTLFIQNYTAWPVYIRFDHQTADESSYHVMIPPACSQTMAVQSAVFSASLAIPAGATWGGNDRVDLVFLARETPPYAAQFALLQVPQQVYSYNVFFPNIRDFVIDLSARPVWGFTILPTLVTDNFPIEIAYSPDGLTWTDYHKLFIPAGQTTSLTRYYTSLLRYARIRLNASSSFTISSQGTLVISQLSQLPERSSYLKHRPYIAKWESVSLAAEALPLTWNDFINQQNINGVLKALHIRLTDFPLTASKLPPFIQVNIGNAGAGNADINLHNMTDKQVFPSGIEGQLSYWAYSPDMTLQTVAYNWVCDIPLTADRPFTMDLILNHPDDIAGVLGASAWFYGICSLYLEV